MVASTRAFDLLSLGKPRIVALLCLTGVAALFAGGGAPFPILIGFLMSGSCIAASAAVFNCYYDRELDQLMQRTADRPLPNGRLDTRLALGVAGSLLVVGTSIALLVLPLEAVAYMLLGWAAYVVLYTILLKRRHWLGVVLGGSAGSFPVLAGWTTVKPIEFEAIVLAVVVFVWTPAHAWALAFVYRSDFVSAGVPTLPAIASEKVVRRAVWFAVLVTIAVAAVAMPFAAAPYSITVVLASVFLILGYLPFYREGTEGAAVRAFFSSNLFLAVIFVAWGFSGITPIDEHWLQFGALVLVPVGFHQLWRSGLSLGGVTTAGGGRRLIRRLLRQS